MTDQAEASKTKPCLRDRIIPPAAVVAAKSRPAEHLGFVAYAAAEVIGANHAVVLAVAAWLLITGLIAFLHEDFSSLFGKGL